MKIRPHHLLCIQKYTGHGYDAAFTAHMTALVSGLSDRPQTQVTLTKGCDALCLACPHNIGGVCTSLEKVDKMDAAVLNACGLSYGISAPWELLARRAKKQIFMIGKEETVCSGCQWFSLCRETETTYEP